MAPVLVLVGAPGSGKTTVGALVADLRGLGFRDTDADVEAAAGCSISDIFVDEGEAGFRRREQAAALSALREHDGVLALGGGAIESTDVREALTGLPVVLLTVSAPEAAKRVGIDGARPMSLGNVRSVWTNQLKTRQPLYESVAVATVDTDELSPDQVAGLVATVMDTTSRETS